MAMNGRTMARAAAVAGFWLTWTALTAEMPPIQRLWDRRFGGDSNEVLKAVVPLPDGGLLLGGDSQSEPSGNKEAAHYGLSDIWLVRLDAQGNKLWDQSYGGEREESLTRILPAPDGGLVLFGTSASPPGGNKTSTPCRPTGDPDLWVVRLDGDGNILWDKNYGTTDAQDQAVTAELTLDGGLIIGARASGRSCTKTSPDYGMWDFWVLRVDRTGAKLWDKTYGGSMGDDLKQIHCLPDGGFLFCAQTQSEISGNKKTPYYGGNLNAGDVWLVRVDATGQILWQQELGGNRDDYYVAALPQADGGWLLGIRSSSDPGGTRSSSWGADDYWLVRLDTDGRILWDASYGGSGGDVLEWLLPRPGGTFLLSGSSYSMADGSRTAPARGDVDVWLVTVDEMGRALWDAAVGVPDGRRHGELAPALGDELFLLTEDVALRIVSFQAQRVFQEGVARLDGRGNLLAQWPVLHETNVFRVPFTWRGRTADGGFYWAGTQQGGPNGEPEPFLTAFRVVKAGPAPVPAPPTGARLLPWAGLQGRVQNDGFLVGLSGTAGKEYILELSSDLRTWMPWRTNLMGQFDLKLRDLAATNAVMRFYRARELGSVPIIGYSGKRSDPQSSGAQVNRRE